MGERWRKCLGRIWNWWRKLVNPNRDKLQFYSRDPIDKIVVPAAQVTIVNDGNTGGTFNWQEAKIVTQTYEHPYDGVCFVRGKWSIDGGTTWNTFETHLLDTFSIILVNPSQPSQMGMGLLAAVSIAARPNEVKIVTANGHHGNVTVNIGTGAQSYSPVSHTFLIEYEIYGAS